MKLLKWKTKRPVSSKVTFELFAPDALKVQLAGTFNGWDADKNPLKKLKSGNWKTEIALPAGRYEYRYLVDGVWENDPGVPECVPNAFGSWNCVLEVR